MEYKIDVILLTCNNLQNTKQCINHLYQFTDNFGLIILDNGSTDGTVEYLKELSKQKDNITLFFSEKNLGIIKGRNAAYKLSEETDFIFFIDNDQYVQEGWLDSYLEIMENFDLVGIEAWVMRTDFFPIKKISSPIDNFSYVGAGGMMVKKKVIDSIGLFDERFEKFYYEDPDFCWRAYDAGFKIGWNYKPVIIHKHQGPLLNKERKKIFMSNWKKFREKWRGKEVPVFKM